MKASNFLTKKQKNKQWGIYSSLFVKIKFE